MAALQSMQRAVRGPGTRSKRSILKEGQAGPTSYVIFAEKFYEVMKNYRPFEQNDKRVWYYLSTAEPHASLVSGDNAHLSRLFDSYKRLHKMKPTCRVAVPGGLLISLRHNVKRETLVIGNRDPNMRLVAATLINRHWPSLTGVRHKGKAGKGKVEVVTKASIGPDIQLSVDSNGRSGMGAKRRALGGSADEIHEMGEAPRSSQAGEGAGEATDTEQDSLDSRHEHSLTRCATGALTDDDLQFCSAP